ncbi:MAG: hypothetical protein FD153_1722 [Rhodospirillaceae bacterium]|nr:MAG: hypothetical protein FD153_1722 [Rhodospirillaceae bacterium]
MLPPRKRWSILGQACCQAATCCTVQLWIPAPRFREDERHGNILLIYPITKMRRRNDREATWRLPRIQEARESVSPRRRGRESVFIRMVHARLRGDDGRQMCPPADGMPALPGRLISGRFFPNMRLRHGLIEKNGMDMSCLDFRTITRHSQRVQDEQ